MRASLLVLMLAACGGRAREGTCPTAPPPAEPAAPEQFVQSTHWGAVTRLAFSGSGRFLASAGEDRTIRVWDVAARRALRIFRVDGELDGLEWDGDARLLVARAHERPVVLDVARAQALAALGDWTRPVPIADRDAHWIGLSSSSFTQSSLALFGPGGDKLAYPVPSPCPDGFSPSEAALARTTGALFAQCDGGGANQWAFWSRDPKGAWALKTLAQGQVLHGITAIAAAPNGRFGVVSAHDWQAPHHQLLLITPTDSAELPMPAPAEVTTLWISPDSSQIVALTHDPWVAKEPPAALLAFDARARRLQWRRTWPSATRFAGSPDGRLLAVGDFEGRLELVDTGSGRTVGRLGAHIRHPFDVAFTAAGVTVSAGGHATAWSLEQAALTTRTRTGRGAEAAAEQAKIDELVALRGGVPPPDPALTWAAAHVAGATAVTRAGERAWVGTENGDLVVLDGDSELARGKSDGLALERLVLAPDGKRLASISSDGIVRIWDAQQAFVRALLVDFEDDEWLIATPRGAYTGTAEVGERIGWVFDAPLEFFSFEQFAGRFRDPALVRRRLAGEDVEPDAAVGQPPRLSLLEAPQGPVAGGSAAVRLRVTGVRVVMVRAYVEGRLVASRALCAEDRELGLDLPLVAGVNQASFVAFDQRGYASNALAVQLVSTRGDLARPTLWVVAVGIGSYPHLLDAMALPTAKRARLLAKLQLPAARADAAAIAGTMAGQPGLAGSHVTTLLDADATAARIRAALAGLADMAPGDIAVVALAGHGFKVSGSGDMRFVTAGGRLTPDGRTLDPASLADATIGWDDLAAALSHARGRVLVLLDACHAGHVSQALLVPNDNLAQRLAASGRAGAIVFAAAKGRQDSFEPGTARSLQLEGAPLRERNVGGDHHGYFTGALLRALGDPVTDRNHDGVLQVSELIEEVSEQVTEASGGLQTPWVVRRDLFGDFGLGRLPAPAKH